MSDAQGVPEVRGVALNARWLTYAEQRRRAAARDRLIRDVFTVVGLLGFGCLVATLARAWLS